MRSHVRLTLERTLGSRCCEFCLTIGSPRETSSNELRKWCTTVCDFCLMCSDKIQAPSHCALRENVFTVVSSSVQRMFHCLTEDGHACPKIFNNQPFRKSALDELEKWREPVHCLYTR